MVLDFTSTVILYFRDNSFRWVDVKHFTFEAEGSARDVLAALVAHRQFREGYIGGPVGEQDVHGPYHLDRISAESYEQVDQPSALAWVRDFCGLYEAHPSAALAADLQCIVERRIAQASGIYRLPVLEEARHEAAAILLEFRELVLIDQAARELALVVMGVD
jgi:hypothetical protein